jgi:hypothetical protein
MPNATIPVITTTATRRTAIDENRLVMRSNFGTLESSVHRLAVGKVIAGGLCIYPVDLEFAAGSKARLGRGTRLSQSVFTSSR